MDRRTVLTKTAKGLMEVTGKTSLLPRDIRNVLSQIDGKATVGDVHQKLEKFSEAKLLDAMARLLREGFVREFVTAPVSVSPPSQLPSVQEDVDLDFTALVGQSGPGKGAPDAAEVEEVARQVAAAREREQAEAKARAAAEAKARAEAEAKAKAEAAARAKREAEERKRREAEERARKQAEEKSRREAEEKARREAEEKARREAAEKARREAEEKAKREAEERAREQAAERAKREKEEALRRELEEEVRRAEERARREAEEKARAAEENARQEAEARARREAEEKARREAEEKARREAEEKARREAEEAARRIAEEKAKREAEEKAKREAEERTKREAEERARREAEEKARREAEESARREAEAKERARRAAEEKARRIAEETARLEAEEKARREAEERERLAAEERIRRELEAEIARASQGPSAAELAAAEARQRAEEEESARRRAEESARREAEARARREAEARERERREAEERARAEADAQRRAELEERARQEAEERARREAEEKARIEAERKAREEERARAKAEAEAAARARKEERAREQAQAEARAEAETPRRAETSSASRRRGGGLGRLVGIGLVVLLVAAAVAAQFMPLDTGFYERLASAKFGAPVKIQSAGFSILPSPAVRFENVVVGADEAVRIASVKAQPELAMMLGETRTFRTLELSGVNVSPAGLGAMLWAKPAGSGDLAVERIVAHDVKVALPGIELPTLEATATLAANGAPQKITLATADKRIVVEIVPRPGRAAIDVTMASLRVPFGSSLVLGDFGARGEVAPGELVLSEFDGRIWDGVVRGRARLGWANGWTLEGDADLRQADATVLVPQLFGAGRVLAQGTFAMSAASPEKLFESARLEGSFTVQKGQLANIDFARMLQTGASKDGGTAFNDLSGQGQVEAGRVELRNLRLGAGVLSATGALDIEGGKAITGKIAAEMKSPQGGVSRASFAVSGALPQVTFRR